MCVLVSVDKLPEDIKRRTLIATVVTVMAINTLSICQKTMAERGMRTMMSNTKNIDSAFVHFI